MSAGGGYMTEFDANSVEKCDVVNASQGYASVYAPAPAGHQSWPSTTASVASSQNLHMTEYGSTENGHPSSSGYQYDQQREMTISRETPTGTNTALHASTPSLGAPSTQEYFGYATYPYSTNSYGYGNSEYQNHYYGYQQPANDSSQQQVGAGQNTGAPYQPLSSFQNASPYVGATSYSSSYYNPGDYQTTSGYPTTAPAGYRSSGYSNQTNSWNGGNAGSYPPYDYSNYTPSDTNSTPNSGTAAGNPLHYQQQYNQWASYYSQTTSSNILCAPGTENNSVTSHSAVQNPSVNTSCGYPYANIQPPPPGTTSWRQDFTPSGLPPSQGTSDTTGYNQNGGWKAGEHGHQNQHVNQAAPYFQTHSDSIKFSHDRSEDQQKTVYSQSSNLQFPLTNQVSQKFQTSSQTASLSDACQMSKIQIPTNPRITSNMAVNMPKSDKENIMVGATSRPAYVSVSVPKLGNKVPTHDTAEKGAFPPSLRSYVERTFARCKDDSHRATNESIMKEMITKASVDGTLFTRNWDTEPLFPLPNSISGDIDNNPQNSVSPLAKFRRSPSRRTKSRWEPLPVEKLAEKLQSVNHNSIKDVWDHKDNGKVANNVSYGSKENGWNCVKFVPAQQQTVPTVPTKNTQRPFKRQRFGDSNTVETGDASSDSDKDQSLTKYYSSAISLANSPEERKRREHRSKRFEKGQERHSEVKYFRPKGAGAGSLYTRRTNALLLAKNYEDNTNRAVEDIDWDSFTVKGASQEIEKRYLRLTSAPDPATVRPEEVLEKALLMVQSSQKNYLYKCDQLKSIRQDLTVQRIHNELTVKVYETHARSALEAGDLSEYNQCQSQLRNLYSEGIKGCHLEFSAYNLLCVILHSSNNRELLSSMARLSVQAKNDEAVKHALSVRAAVTSGNYILFFRLYKKAPNLNTCLMDLYVEKMRFDAVRCMCKSYRPTVPIAYIALVLGFSKLFLPVDSKEDRDGLEECEEWLRTHGATLTTDSNGEMQLDAKASASTLYMPEPEDAVAHGDTSLAVDDFLTRPS